MGGWGWGGDLVLSMQMNPPDRRKTNPLGQHTRIQSAFTVHAATAQTATARMPASAMIPNRSNSFRRSTAPRASACGRLFLACASRICLLSRRSIDASSGDSMQVFWANEVQDARAGERGDADLPHQKHPLSKAVLRRAGADTFNILLLCCQGFFSLQPPNSTWSSNSCRSYSLPTSKNDTCVINIEIGKVAYLNSQVSYANHNLLGSVGRKDEAAFGYERYRDEYQPMVVCREHVNLEPNTPHNIGTSIYQMGHTLHFILDMRLFYDNTDICSNRLLYANNDICASQCSIRAPPRHRPIQPRSSKRVLLV
jgi:hypothetical protein